MGKNFLGKFKIIVGDDIVVNLCKINDKLSRNWIFKIFKNMLSWIMWLEFLFL